MDIYFMLLCICLITIYYVVYLICTMHLVCNVKGNISEYYSPPIYAFGLCLNGGDSMGMLGKLIR